jgi:hypothetical protein
MIKNRLLYSTHDGSDTRIKKEVKSLYEKFVIDFIRIDKFSFAESLKKEFCQKYIESQLLDCHL